MRSRRALSLLALACFAACALLAFVALDARAWGRTITRDDLRFRALHSHVGLWRSPALLPSDPVARVLGLSEPLAYRHAIQLFWFSRVGSDPDTREDLPTIRFEAQDQLERLIAAGRTAHERSSAANLLGILTVTTPATDTETQTQTLVRAAQFFQKAIDLDATDVAAKLNLELVLRLRRPGKSKLGKDARGGYGFGRGHGAGVSGGGF